MIPKTSVFFNSGAAYRQNVCFFTIFAIPAPEIEEQKSGNKTADQMETINPAAFTEPWQPAAPSASQTPEVQNPAQAAVRRRPRRSRAAIQTLLRAAAFRHSYQNIAKLIEFLF
jgi:hypothetical protein